MTQPEPEERPMPVEAQRGFRTVEMSAQAREAMLAEGAAQMARTRTLSMETEPAPEDVTITQAVQVLEPLPERRPGRSLPRLVLRLLGLLAGAALIALAGYLIFRDDRAKASLPLRAAQAREIPPTLRPYYDRAMTGDPAAMRMLGTMYYNGLNVSQDREEGILWFRKAAQAGSVAARKDLEQLGIRD
jgi:TPR repeat protein